MKARIPNALQVHQMTIAQFQNQFPDEDACKEYLSVNRWPEVVQCPRCGNPNVYVLETRAYHWQCHNCAVDGYRFSVLVGTIFENTNKPLHDWFRVMHMMLTSKKGISALQVYRVMGFGSYNTALLMCNKIRAAFGNVEFKRLIGYVEVYETYTGRKAKNKHKGPGGRGDFGGTGGHGKAIIAGAVKRKGNVIARVIANTSAETLSAFVRMAVSTRVSLVSTDEHKGYTGLHHLVKRGIVGTFHKVSKKYLPLYVNEFEFRCNNCHNADIFGTAIPAC